MTSGLLAALVLVALLAVAFRLRPTSSSAVDFYLAGRDIGTLTNAWAICGDYVSAASFLGVAAAVYASGVDGAWFAAGFAAGFVPVVLFVAAPLRRFGEFSIPDFLGRRFGSDAVRAVAVGVVLLVILAYLVPQAVGSGLTGAVLVGVGLPGLTAEATGVVVVTVLMAGLVTFGGMRGTTWTQAVQFLLLLAAALWLLAAALGAGFSYPSAIADLGQDPLTAVVGGSVVPVEDVDGGPARFDRPGARYDVIGQVALVTTLVLGTAGLPHILNRFFTSPTGRAARRTGLLVLANASGFYAIAVTLGVAARQLVRTAEGGELSADAIDGLLALPEQAILALGELLGGRAGLAAVSLAALIAITSTVAGLLLAAAASLGHDVYLRLLRPDATSAEVVRAGRLAVVATALTSGAAALLLSTEGLSARFPSLVAQMVTWAFAIAGSALTPVLLAAIWWRRTTAAGAVAAMVTGGVGAVVAILAGLATDAGSVGASALLVTPSAVTAGAATLVLVVVSHRTAPPEGTDEMWITMHGTAADRRAERLARLTVEGL